MMENNIKKLVLIITISICCSCKDQESKVETGDYNTPEKEQKIIDAYLKNPENKKKLQPIDTNSRTIENLSRKSLHGDIKSYNFLVMLYSRSENQEKYYDLQSISKIMVDKYNFSYPCRQIYRDIVRKSNNDKDFDEKLFFNLSKEAKKEALYYLKKGASLNDPECKLILAKSYKHGYGVPKNDKKADSLIRSLNWPKTLTDHELKKL